MPRNSSGVYTLPSGNPVVPGTTIDAAWANDTMEDMANELTNSLSRTGAGGMLAPFRIANGTVTAPGISYLNETNTGLYRSGAGSVWMSVLGVNTVQFSTVGMTIPVGKALTAQGNASVGGTLAVTGATTLASSLAVIGAITATGGVLGNVTAASGTSTFNNVTINGNLDMDAGSSGTITNLPNPTNSGDAANKAYVDSQDALRLALTGGTMTGVIAMSNNKVTGVATPTADQDAANKAYVDSLAQGLDAKASCAAATTANVTLSGTQTIDGYALAVGQRVLVKDQSAAADNGIYVVASGSWSRAADANTWDELVAAFTFVEHGSTNANNGYICTIPVIGTLGTTPVTWAQFSGAGQINAGTGMSKTGNTLNVNTASASRIVVGADEIDLATTGVIADTYKSVSVDAYGRVTGGTNPTTLAGFGIGDAYTQTQTNSLLNAKLSLTGGTMSAALAMGTNKITGLGDPTNAQDAATKNYIDTIFGSTTTAAASAAAAASSASAASSSATSASGSASAAAASATSAAASFDSFDDRYLGAKASDPTVDNDGNPLLTGALYWNSTVNEMRAYSGSAWVAAYIPSSAYAALASANVFTANQTITVNTSSDALRITQNGSGNALYIEDVATDATPFVVSSTGVVGIGTTTPDNVTSAGIALVSNDGFFPQVVTRNKTADANASYMVFDKDRAGAIVQNGDVLGNLIFRGFDGTQYLQGAYINAVVSAAPGTNDMPTRMAFGVTPDGSAGPSEGMNLTGIGLGVGTNSPASKLQVGAGSPRETTASFFGTGNSIASSIATVGIYSTDTAGAGVGPSLALCGRTNNGVDPYPFALIQGAKNSATAGDYGGYLQFNTIPANGGSPIPNLTLTTGGGVQAYNTISVGAAGPATSGAGITFPASQSPSSNANTLDDYEEGTWSPIFNSSGTAIVASYNNRNGSYTKIGNMVTIYGYIGIASVSSATGSYLRIGNLPFNCASSSGLGTGNAGGIPAGSSCVFQGFTGLSSGDVIALGAVDSATSEINIWKMNGNGSFGTGLGGGNVAAGLLLYFTVTYRTD